MIKKIIFIPYFLTCLCVFASASEKTKTFDSASYSDIFISSQKADISVFSDDGIQSAITWRPKLCKVIFNKPSEGVLEIVIEPEKQNSFLKKLLMIPRSRCKIKLNAGENKHIYASSQTGDIRFFNINSKTARAYSGQGVVETSDVKGDFSAETLTDKINIRNFDGKNLSIKTASGNISVTGKAHEISLLNTSGNTKMAGTAENLMFYSSQGSLSAKWDSLPQEHLNISAHSFSGNIKIHLPKMTEDFKNNSSIDLKTFYGNCEVEEK